jgi:Na+-translocating ferredoxin:NAD+ oxidoreductase RnfG subunit
MFKILSFFLLFFALELSAKILISPTDSMKMAFGEGVVVEKKNILLKSAQAQKIQKAAQTKLPSKIVRIYTAKKGSDIVGYGVLISKKIRSKNGVVLYHITKDNKLLSMEVISFNEPPEYIPTKNWTKQFENTGTDEMLHVSKNIPTISGATLSANAITDGSRIAFAFYNELLKRK